MLNFKTAVAIALAAVVIPVYAQTSATPPANATATPGVDKREVNQQKRIDQGVKSGSLTAKETNNLDKREAKIAADKTAAKADGKVTKAERKKLHKEQNHASATIAKDKHNAKTLTK